MARPKSDKKRINIYLSEGLYEMYREQSEEPISHFVAQKIQEELVYFNRGAEGEKLAEGENDQESEASKE